MLEEEVDGMVEPIFNEDREGETEPRLTPGGGEERVVDGVAVSPPSLSAALEEAVAAPPLLGPCMELLTELVGVWREMQD